MQKKGVKFNKATTACKKI